MDTLTIPLHKNEICAVCLGRSTRLGDLKPCWDVKQFLGLIGLSVKCCVAVCKQCCISMAQILKFAEKARACIPVFCNLVNDLNANDIKCINKTLTSLTQHKTTCENVAESTYFFSEDSSYLSKSKPRTAEKYLRVSIEKLAFEKKMLNSILRKSFKPRKKFKSINRTKKAFHTSLDCTNKTECYNDRSSSDDATISEIKNKLSKNLPNTSASLIKDETIHAQPRIKLKAISQLLSNTEQPDPMLKFGNNSEFSQITHYKLELASEQIADTQNSTPFTVTEPQSLNNAEIKAQQPDIEDMLPSHTVRLMRVLNFENASNDTQGFIPTTSQVMTNAQNEQGNPITLIPVPRGVFNRHVNAMNPNARNNVIMLPKSSTVCPLMTNPESMLTRVTSEPTLMPIIVSAMSLSDPQANNAASSQPVDKNVHQMKNTPANFAGPTDAVPVTNSPKQNEPARTSAPIMVECSCRDSENANGVDTVNIANNPQLNKTASTNASSKSEYYKGSVVTDMILCHNCNKFFDTSQFRAHVTSDICPTQDFCKKVLKEWLRLPTTLEKERFHDEFLSKMEQENLRTWRYLRTSITNDRLIFQFGATLLAGLNSHVGVARYVEVSLNMLATLTVNILEAFPCKDNKTVFKVASLTDIFLTMSVKACCNAITYLSFYIKNGKKCCNPYIKNKYCSLFDMVGNILLQVTTRSRGIDALIMHINNYRTQEHEGTLRATYLRSVQLILNTTTEVGIGNDLEPFINAVWAVTNLLREKANDITRSSIKVTEWFELCEATIVETALLNYCDSAVFQTFFTEEFSFKIVCPVYQCEGNDLNALENLLCWELMVYRDRSSTPCNVFLTPALVRQYKILVSSWSAFSKAEIQKQKRSLFVNCDFALQRLCCICGLSMYDLLVKWKCHVPYICQMLYMSSPERSDVCNFVGFKQTTSLEANVANLFWKLKYSNF